MTDTKPDHELCKAWTNIRQKLVMLQNQDIYYVKV